VIKDHLVFMISTKYTQVGDNVAMQMVSVLGLLLELSKYTRLNLLFVSLHKAIMLVIH